MCKMLLSINPEHVENILAGAKKFEFRKVACKSTVDKIVIYATAPIKAIVAEVELLSVIIDDIDEVWRLTKTAAGISYDFFSAYYQGKQKAVAYELGNVIIYDHPKTLRDFGLSFAPQSFVYLDTP